MRQFRRVSVSRGSASRGTAWAGPSIPTVALLGCSCATSDLATFLPADWRITATDRRDEPRGRPDVLVLTDASAAEVRDLCERFGDVPVVCTISPEASASEAIAVLRAGADACVRSQGALVLSAHIRACQRRRQARGAAVPARTSALSGTGAVA